MGARTYWRAPVPPLGYSDGPTSSLSTLTDISPVPAVLVPPIWELGSRLHIKAFGWYTATVATAGVTAGIYLQPLTTAISATYALAVSPSFTPATTASQWPWWLELEGEVRALPTVATGSGGSIEIEGLMLWGASLTTFNAAMAIPASYALRTVAIPVAGALNLPLYCQVGVVPAATTTLIACNHLDVALSG